MQVAGYLDELRRQGDALALVAARTGLDATVPSCPGWAVRDLIGHTGAVYRWASAHIRAGADRQRIDFGQPPEDDVLDWFREGLELVLNTITEAPADWQCWTFFEADSPKQFWARRQAHESAIHRADGEEAAGAVARFATDFAVDGIDELLAGFLPRRARGLVADPSHQLIVEPVDSAVSWQVRVAADGCHTRRLGGGEAAPDTGVDTGRLRGTASDLYLWLWNRRPETLVLVTGDDQLPELWRERARIT